MELSWPDVLIAFAVCHVVGDYLLQTDHQARRKRGGAGRDRTARRALAAHLGTYTLAFAPAVAWLAVEGGAGRAAAAVLAVALPHAVVDDGRLVCWWLRRVKRVEGPPGAGLAQAVDQSLHVVSLWAAAVLLSL